MAEFIGSLKDFQIEGYDFALSTPYHINNFQAGLGKTITSLAVACKVGGKILIICPAFLRKNWIKEIEKFTKNLDYEIISYSGLDKFANFEFKKIRGKKTRLLVGLKKDLTEYNMVIADEIHAAKNNSSNRTKIIHAYLSRYRPKYFMGLTGTPVSNRVSEFHSLLQLCFYGGKYLEFTKYYNLYHKFCNDFSYERTFEINGFPIVRYDGLKKNKIPELKRLIKPVLIRRRADQVLKDLPDEVEIDIVGSSKKYDEYLKKALELFSNNPKDPAYMTLKSSNALAKIETTLKLARELIEQGNRPLIFTCHKEAARKLAKKLNCPLIEGSVDPDKRQDIINDFNKNKNRALVATVGSASTGFNITSTNYTIFNDIDFTPEKLEQSKKRTRRIGQNKTCFYYYIYTSDFDKYLTDMVNRKDQDIQAIFEGMDK
jgi:SNF2 family DNA or RNA helicase